MAPLRAAIGAYPGVVIEDKGVSLAIHYRRAANAERARESIEDAARLLRRARIIPGKEALHLLPVGGVAKCAALNRVRVKVSCARALYFGDDGTDEEAFAAGPAVTGVRIGHSTSSAAEYFLHGQEEIDAALERLIALRASKQIAPERWRVAAPRGIKPSRD
jgi:trehalose 6-phosphate phosphatase